MRLLIQHRSRYRYPRPATLGPHLIRLRPADHTPARVESYGLHVSPTAQLRWQQDPYGNRVARVAFRKGTRVETLELLVELGLEVRPINPFDFFLDEIAETVPVPYPSALREALAPYLVRNTPEFIEGPRFQQLDAALPSSGRSLPLLTTLNQEVAHRVRYVLRDEPGVWTPEQTLTEGRASCRDSAVLMVALLRARGLAARFVSGYLVQLADEGMLPDEPKGVGRDVVDLHAWAEVFLPGAGWIGLDATSGLLCGEGHVPLACSASPALAAPVEGTSDCAASEITFDVRVGRLGHVPRPTAPFPEPAYQVLLESADRADQQLRACGLSLTSGGEPTFNSREHAEAPEWNEGALGPTKWTQGLRLAGELRRRMLPGAALIAAQGKHYPGESLPRWSLELVGRADGKPIWSGDVGPFSGAMELEQVQRVMETVARRLSLPAGVLAAFEDPWHFIEGEAALPLEVDALTADLDDGEERRRLARVLRRGLRREVGYVLPLARKDGRWVTDAWKFRRGRLFLLPGDGPIGLRLPLTAILGGEVPEPEEPPVLPPDPRRPEVAALLAEKQERRLAPTKSAREPLVRQRPSARPGAVRTALCVEGREGELRVFLPPLARAEDFLGLVEVLDGVRAETGLPLLLEGYIPPRSPLLRRFSVTPDPGVLEVNVPPAASGREHAGILEATFEAALHAGLHSEKYLLDGRISGSGGGHHLTLGGPTALESPLLVRPDVLASLLTLLQHHPSLSYLFTGLFVGPTSQAPRVDEARHDALPELEIALARAFQREGEPLTPWMVDGMFRDLLVDVSGNTHRAELCIDKLFDWRTAHGRQGVVELRAFEMPAHPRLAVAQAVLVRSLVASVAREPYRGKLVRWGTRLHDRFLLPYWMWSDFEEVLAHLSDRGVALPGEAYRPFLELRCPVAGRIEAGDVALEIRNALEPWNVLGEEVTAAGTARYVDSSVERVEVRVEGLVPERHRVLVSGWELPLRSTGTMGEAVGGVRFRAWAPPRSLHPHLGVHHPLRFDVVDGWTRRSLGACAYHVWHAGGRGFRSPPLTRFEAEARRSQRFTRESPMPWPVTPRPTQVHPDTPWTLDLRRLPGDHPIPEPDEEDPTGAAPS
ncbi:MAG TPA: transglutaminase family protein [Myxococcaceae bacterium]